MARGKRLSDIGVAALKARSSRYVSPDPELPGHYIRVQPSGAKYYVAVARDPSGKQVWHTVGPTTLFNIDDARARARKAILAIRSGAERAGPQSFESVAQQWFKRHVETKKLRSADNLRRTLDKHLLPAWRGRDFTSIRRSDVAKLLDTVEDESGPVAADFVLAIVRNIANWFATRHENYSSPIVRGMKRSNPSERARTRILNDDELRQIWREASSDGVFGACIRLALLTAQRREKLVRMKWEDVSVDGHWKIQSEAREKGTGIELTLPKQAINILRAQPRYCNSPYVFSGRADKPISGYHKRKAQIDAKAQIEPWVFHDLRRTARSLMSRAGVRPEVAERVLGHSVGGVEGIYDRHGYLEEKAEALRLLAELVESIVATPPAPTTTSPTNVGATPATAK
jgi:integrase